MATSSAVSIGAFLDSLYWLDGTRLRIEPYRRRLFEAFASRDDTGRLLYNLALCGRAKKNNKTLDAMLQAMYCLFDESPQGSQVYVVANDEDQAADDLDLLKKVFRANPRLLALVTIRKNRIERQDGGGFIEVLPARDAIGAHGKTYRLLVCDEIHGWRDWDLLEALAPDPTRADAQQWIASYATLFHKPGVPLHDLLAAGKAGSDPRMLFSWHAADHCTDPDSADRTPEERANPSMASWSNDGYLEQQRLRLPAHKYRRLHLNLPGLPEGAPFAADSVFDAFDRGVASRAPVSGVRYSAFVDMSGGSNDDAVLAIGHVDADGRAVVDRLLNQGPPPPFDPNKVLDRFVRVCQDYGVTRVVGDRYAGLTFQMQFATQGIRYAPCEKSASELYEALEPRLNSHEVLLLDVPLLEQQLLGLVWRGARIDHPSGEHDDHAAAVAGLVEVLLATSVRVGGVLAGKCTWGR